MQTENVITKIQSLGINLEYINLNDLNFHLTELNKKIRLIDELEIAKEYVPKFTLTKSRDNNC